MDELVPDTLRSCRTGNNEAGLIVRRSALRPVLTVGRQAGGSLLLSPAVAIAEVQVVIAAGALILD